MSQKRIGIRIIKITSYTLGVLLLLALLINLWFRFYAERTLEKIVSLQSNGTLALQLGKLDFTYRENQLNFEDIEIHSVTNSGSISSYQFKVKKLRIKTRSLWDFAWKKELAIEAFEINEPETSISILKAQPAKEHNLSIPEELGRVYDGIKKALKVLKVRRFEINEGVFHLTNTSSPNQVPMDVSHIQMVVDNLNIDSSTVMEKEKFLSADSVILRIYNQQLQLPDGKHQLSFSRFRFNSGLKLIEMDSCSFQQKQSDSNHNFFNLFFDTLKLANLSVSKLYLENKLEADSAYCINPHFQGTIGSAEKKLATTLPVEKNSAISSSAFKDLFFDIKYVGINNAQLNVAKQEKHKQSHFSSSQNSFAVYGFRSNDSTLGKIKVDSIKLKLLQNELYTADSVYAIRFKDIVIKDDQLILDKLTITTDPQSNTNIRRKHSMDRFVLSGMDWTELIFNKNIKAEKATLYRPVVDRKNTIALATSSRQNLFDILKTYGKKFSLNELEIVDGDLHMQIAPGKSFDIKNGSLVLSVNEVFTANTYNQLLAAIKKLQMKKLKASIQNMSLDLDKVSYNARRNEFAFNTLNIQEAATDNRAVATQVVIANPQINDSLKKFQISGIRWKSATAHWRVPDKAVTKTSGSGPTFDIGFINGTDSRLQVSKGSQTINTLISSIQLKGLQTKPDDAPQMDNIDLTGSNLFISHPTLRLTANNYSIEKSNKLTIGGITLEKETPDDTLSVRVPAINIEASINDLLNGNIKGTSIEIKDPTIRIRSNSIAVKEKTGKEKGMPVLNWKNIWIRNATANIHQQKTQSTDSLVTVFTLKATTLTTTKENIATIGFLRLDLDSISFNQKGSMKLTALSPVMAMAQDLRIEKKGEGWDWKGYLKQLIIPQAILTKNQLTDSLIEVEARDLTAGDLVISNQLLKKPATFISENEAADFKAGHIQVRNKVMTGQLYSLHYNAARQELRIDSVTTLPHQSREEFALSRPFQSTYIAARTGAIVINRPDLKKLATDSALYIKSVLINQPVITAYRDKNLPFQYGIIKPLPTTLLQSIPFRFRIDTVQLKDALLRYTEKSDKTRDTGTIFLSNTQALLFPVTSMKMTEQDSIRLRVTTHIMGTAPVSLHFKESYTDSLAGFWVTARMPSTDLTCLNQALAPLLSVKLTSGTLDTLSFRAIGRDYLSFGEMKMLYHNLHVQFLKNGVEKKTLLTSLLTFAANSFVVKTNNTHRTGIVFFPRIRDKAVFNYWVKMVLSGMASSVGAKSNRKALRQYKKELRKRQLPPIEFAE